MMQNYQDIFKYLSLDDKLDLIISSRRLRNGELENYEFPLVTENNNALALTNGKIKDFHFLGMTWNQNLIEDFGEKLGLNNHKNLISIHMSEPSNNENLFSSDDYLSGKIVGSLIKGINKSNALSGLSIIPNNVLNDSYYYNMVLKSYRIATKIGNPTIIETSNPNINALIMNFKLKSFYSYYELEPNSIPKALYEGALFITSENKNEVKNAINAYKDYQEKLIYGEITRAEFEALEQEGKIFDENKIDKIVSNILDFLVIYNEKTHQEFIEIEPDYTNLFNESILLLKNSNNTLPLIGNYKCTLIGDTFEREFETKSNALSLFQKYTIPTKNYVHGLFDDIDTERLLEPVIKELNSNESNVVITMIELENGLINKNIEKLLDAIVEHNVYNKKLILVTIGNEIPKINLHQYCDSLLYIPEYNNGFIDALLKTIIGKNNPSARTNFVSSHKSTTKNRLSLENELIKPVYPFGYGLSYSKFKYTNIELSKASIKLTIENISKYDGYEIIELYTKTPYEGSLRLAGFEKIYLHANEKRVLEIPFDEYSFSYYDENKKLYGIKAGTYNVLLCSDIDTTIWESTLELEEYFEKEATDSINEIDSSLDDSIILENKKQLSFKKKLIISISIDAYYTIMLVILIIINLFQANNLLITILLSSLAIISNIVFISLLTMFIKNKNNSLKISDAMNLDKLSTLISSTKDFDEADVVKYETPVLESTPRIEIPEDKEEAPIIEENEPIVEEKEEVEKNIVIDEGLRLDLPEDDDEEYDDSYVATPIVYEQKENYQNISLDDLCKKFNQFALDSGFVLELYQLRALLASALSTKLIFATSNDPKNLIKVLNLLDKFFGNISNPLVITPDVYKMRDILWKPYGNKYTYSDFTIDILKAKLNPNSLKIMVVDNVDVEIFPRYFYKFIRQASTPRLPQTIRLEKLYEMPNNVCYIIVPTKDNYMELVSSKLLDSSLNIHLDIKISTYNEIDIEPVSYPRLNEEINEAKKTIYLEEDDWKKLDDLEDEIKEIDPSYNHSNISALLTDKLATVLYTLDKERYVLDDLLSMYYIPYIKSTKIYKMPNGDATLKNILDQIFGLDNIPNSLNLIKKNNTNQNNVETKKTNIPQEESIVNEEESSNKSIDTNLDEQKVNN